MAYIYAHACAPIYGLRMRAYMAHCCPYIWPMNARMYGPLLPLYMAYEYAHVWPIPYMAYHAVAKIIGKVGPLN